MAQEEGGCTRTLHLAPLYSGWVYALQPLRSEECMAKYGKTAQKKVERAMRERKHGTLKSGRSGRKVKSRKQAIAIGLSEARRAGAKVPSRRGRSRKRGGGRRKGGRSRAGSRKK
jgi:hypothetical protein